MPQCCCRKLVCFGPTRTTAGNSKENPVVEMGSMKVISCKFYLQCETSAISMA